MVDSSVLFIGGRSGVGKSSAASALHELLAARRIRHAVIEGDTLDLAWPAPWERGDDTVGRNLRSLWQNYRAAGFRRLVYTNTVSVLEARQLSAAMADDPRVVAVLLRASDTTTASRLSRRESGDSLDLHLERSARRAVELDDRAGPDVHRIDTDGMSAAQVAAELLRLTGWTAPGASAERTATDSTG